MVFDYRTYDYLNWKNNQYLHSYDGSAIDRQHTKDNTIIKHIYHLQTAVTRPWAARNELRRIFHSRGLLYEWMYNEYYLHATHPCVYYNTQTYNDDNDYIFGSLSSNSSNCILYCRGSLDSPDDYIQTECRPDYLRFFQVKSCLLTIVNKNIKN